MDSQVETLRILQLEEVASDAERAVQTLVDQGMSIKSKRVKTESAFKKALKSFTPNVVLSNYHLSHYSGLDALDFTIQNYPHTPVIILTDILGDEQAVDLLRHGARDYVLKDQLTRLPYVVRRVLEEEREIIEHEHAEENLALFRAILDQSNDSIEIIDPATLRFLDANEGACRELGYSREELLSMTVMDIDPHVSEYGEKVIAELTRSGQVRFETDHLRKDGSLVPVEINVTHIALNKGKAFNLAITRDISERKRAEQMLLESKEKYKRLVENSPVLIYSFSLKRGGIYYSPEVARTLGCSLDELYADAMLWNKSIHPDDRERVQRAIEGLKEGIGFELEYRVRDVHGSWHWLLDRSIDRHEEDGDIIVDGLAMDITARKLNEQERQSLLQEARRNSSQLETIFATQRDILMLFGLDMRVMRCTPQFAQEYGFDPIGLHVSEIMRQVSSRNLDGSPVPLGDNLPTPHALQGIEAEGAQAKVTRADGSEAIVEVYSRPYYIDGAVHGAVTVWRDITQLRRATEEAENYARQLERSMQETLEAVSNMVEQRDPYTAGHERRVGMIAADIAREMGWPERKCTELELIGLVHDIGKISIPAEILSKPGRLTAIEYEIVKTHVEKGYEILKNVHFPLPIADIIHQHHERLDGSGYPQGLKEEQILHEARILAVADVLESMASHRPYRPALGVDAALDELTGKRGKLYDPEVIDALLGLIHGGYQLPN